MKNEHTNTQAFSKRLSILRWSGVAATALGVIAAVMLPYLTHSTGGHFAGLVLFLILFTAGIDLNIYAYIMKENVFLPVDDKSWRFRLDLFCALVMTGFTLLIAAVVIFFAVSLTTNLLLGSIIGILTFATGMGLMIYGNISWKRYANPIKEQLN